MLEKIVAQIPKEQLVVNGWYLGRGRNSNIGFWDGTHFLTLCYKFQEWVVKNEGYYTETDGCFQPFYKLPEGEMIKPFGAVAWDNHYGEVLKVVFE